jgi:hypothetical protein
MTPRPRAAALGLAAALIAGCSVFRWAERRDAPYGVDHWSAADLVVSTGTAKARRPPERDEIPLSLYYMDLGPAEIDVSRYPTQQKRNYAVFKMQCGRCHTLARAVNSPVKRRAYWAFHVARMNHHARRDPGGQISRDDVQAILDFLAFDAQVRKIDDAESFERQTAELQRRFDPVLEELIRRLQEERQPVLLPRGELQR